MKKKQEPESGFYKYKLLLTVVLGFFVLCGSSVLLWQINKQTKTAPQDENIALKNQLDDLNKKIDELNKSLEELKNSSPTVESKTFIKSSSGKVAGDQSSKGNGLININSASASQLDSLPGIGPSYAQRIIEYRNSSGGFKAKEELKNIKGIGDKTFDKLKDLITI